MAVFSIEQVVRAEGFAKAAMNGMIISTGANVILDITLILWLHMGVLGAGIATVAANVLGLIYYISYIQRKSKYLSLKLHDLKPATHILRPIFVIGSSELVQSAFMFTSTLIINNLAVRYSNDFVAGIGAAQRIVQIPETLAMGIFFGALPLLAYSLGAGDLDRTRQALRTAALWILGLSTLIGLFVFIGKDAVLEFMGGSALIEGGHMILIAMLISTLFNGLTGLAITWFQASGQGLPAIIMTAAQGVLLIPIMLFMNHQWEQTGLIRSLTTTEVLTCTVAALLFIFTGKVAGAATKQAANA
ncbi:MAG: MATE family efflux transporter [Rothia sp. (in: high G+C Gram-positive bacteria)]|nr:MATE family efflux transporter [Rothia sp. (in: high G+C Gram-positive bacteria)]